MSDQCRTCTSRGNFKLCVETPCFHHENWYEVEMQRRLNVYRQGLDEALKYMNDNEKRLWLSWLMDHLEDAKNVQQ